MMEIDHEAKQVYCEQLKTPTNSVTLVPSDDTISQRLTNPIVITYVDTDKISFERYSFGDPFFSRY